MNVPDVALVRRSHRALDAFGTVVVAQPARLLLTLKPLRRGHVGGICAVVPGAVEQVAAGRPVAVDGSRLGPIRCGRWGAAMQAISAHSKAVPAERLMGPES